MSCNNGKYPQAVFLDRDGTIGGNGKLVKPDDFVLYPYAKPVIKLLKDNGIKVLYIPLTLHHVHGVLEPLSRKMRTIFTETVPLHDFY